jgi:hypothetical protein
MEFFWGYFTINGKWFPLFLSANLKACEGYQGGYKKGVEIVHGLFPKSVGCGNV